MSLNLCYAVRKGRKPGIYDKWIDCYEQVNKFQGAEYKKFYSTEDAQKFIDGKETEIIKKENMEKK